MTPRSIPAVIRFRGESDEDYERKVLNRVTASRRQRDQAETAFRSTVAQAHLYGCSMREIAKAAGYSSPSPIQNIISKQK